jgi:NADPH:quinone reductase-like Zn-dependent oxidoreductase
VGSGVTEYSAGDRVAGTFFPAWNSGPFEMSYHTTALGGPGADGMLAEYVTLPTAALVRIPEYLSFQQAACLPCAAVTAWQSLVVRGGLRKNQTILTLGTGGVSLFSLQIGLAMGCRVIVTSSRDEKLLRAKQLGATHTINYTTNPDWEKEVLRLTQKRGVDQVIEVGGGGTLPKSMASVSAGGHIALIGVLTGFDPPSESLFPLVAKNASLSGIYVGSRSDFQALNAFLSEHRIVPVIDRVFPWNSTTEAFELLESANHFGKIVIQII